MAVTPELFYRGAAATTSATLYTAPSKAVLTDIVVSNTSANQQYVTITVDGVNIVPAVPVSANQVVNLQFKTVVPSGDVIAGFATSTDVKFHVSGVEIA